MVDTSTEHTSENAQVFVQSQLSKSEVLQDGEGGIYLEDTLPPEREHLCLRPMIDQGRRQRAEKGIITGDLPSNSGDDVAVFPTLRTAAPFQSIRRSNLGLSKNEFIVCDSDLRRWRRQPLSERFYIFVIDMTSVRDTDWSSALVPHVREAYIHRAAASVVLIGAKKRSRRISSRIVYGP